MATVASSHSPVGTWKWIVPVILVVWFAVVYTLLQSGAYMVPPGQPPLPLAIGYAVPLVVFAALYFAAPGFRDFVLALDLRTVTALQAWRVIGGMFLALYAFGQLPGLFAWPAGAGDVAIGLAAVYVLHRLMNDATFAATRGFVAFNVLGLLDFAGAFATGALGADPALVGEVTTAPLLVLPLGLIPGFLVPAFTILHIIALIHARKLAR